VWGQVVIQVQGTVDGVHRDLTFSYVAHGDEALKRALCVALVTRLPERALSEAFSSLSDMLHYYEYKHPALSAPGAKITTRARALPVAAKPELVILEQE
jgi:hypothetical protein